MRLLSWRIRLFILPSFLSFYLGPLIYPIQIGPAFYFGIATLTGGSFVWKILLLLFFGRERSWWNNPSLNLTFSSLVDLRKVNRSGSFSRFIATGEYFYTSSCLCEHRELSLPSFYLLGRKKSWGSLLDIIILAAAVLNLL